MDRRDVCILINSTPKYYYILPFMVGMLKRYAPELKWPIIFATESPEHFISKALVREYQVQILEIPASSAGFLESRLVALQTLQMEYKYCLPLQDDFILEGPMNAVAIRHLLYIMDEESGPVSARLMPCPGPRGSKELNCIELPDWRYLSPKVDTYGFIFQATLWSLPACVKWYSKIVDVLDEIAPKDKCTASQRIQQEVGVNLAENSQGQDIFWKLSAIEGYKHIAWIRKGSQPNAVYLSPFPYRPTAIVRGSLEGWAQDLAKREGFII